MLCDNSFWISSFFIISYKFLTNFISFRPSEDGKPKCAVYWPENDDKLELSTVDVEKVGEENSDFETLLFKVQLRDEFKQSPFISNKDPLVVKQYRWST